MTAATTSQNESPQRGRPVAGRRALDNLNFSTRTTGEAAAARSKMVRRLRIALPALAIVLIGVFLMKMRSNDVEQAFLDDFKDLSAATDDLRMANPRFDGVDDNGTPFEITAATAKQAPDSRDLVELDKPRAVQGADDKKTVVTAGSGLYRSDENILELKDGVELEHKFGDETYKLKSPAATVSIDDETVVSDAGMEGEGTDGATLKADKMRAYHADKRVVFEGNVSMRIYPKTAKTAEQETEEHAPE